MPRPKGLLGRYRSWRDCRRESAPHRKELAEVDARLHRSIILVPGGDPKLAARKAELEKTIADIRKKHYG